jgi:hypothetical protein
MDTSAVARVAAAALVLFGIAVLPALAAERLPPGALRGQASRLDQYPTLSLATTSQRAAATRLLAELRARGRVWSSPASARKLGYHVGRARRTARNRRTVMWLHAESRAYSNDRLYLDPRRPESLIYADVAGRRLVLIGVMFAMPRGKLGPTPGGPITRWHAHLVCIRGSSRGTAPRADGSCPRGAKLKLGSEMLHVWFTRDLRSAFAIHAPVPELCAARLVRGRHCGHAGHG